MKKLLIISENCSRCSSASRGAVSPKKCKKPQELSSPLTRSRRQNNHQSIQSPCAESPACAAERSTKRARCHNSCSLYWGTSSTKHDPLHSVHIQETGPCQEKQQLPAQTGSVSSAGRGRCPGHWVWLQGMVAPNPNSAVMWGRGGARHVEDGISWGSEGGEEEAFFTSRCDPHLLPLPK